VTVNQSDRIVIEHTFNELFAWITELNVADAVAPRFRFYEEAEARGDMAKYLIEAHKLLDIKRSEVYERLQLTAPQETDEIIPVQRTDDSGRRRCPVQPLPKLRSKP